MALKQIIPVSLLQQPEQGPKAVYTPFLFNTRGVQVIADDLAFEQQSGAFEIPQAIWIDNKFNAQNLTLQFLGLPLVIQVRAGRQGVYPIVCTSGIARWTAFSTGNVDVPAVMFNTAIQPWWQDV